MTINQNIIASQRAKELFLQKLMYSKEEYSYYNNHKEFHDLIQSLAKKVGLQDELLDFELKYMLRLYQTNIEVKKSSIVRICRYLQARLVIKEDFVFWMEYFFKYSEKYYYDIPSFLRVLLNPRTIKRYKKDQEKLRKHHDKNKFLNYIRAWNDIAWYFTLQVKAGKLPDKGLGMIAGVDFYLKNLYLYFEDGFGDKADKLLIRNNHKITMWLASGHNIRKFKFRRSPIVISKKVAHTFSKVKFKGSHNLAILDAYIHSRRMNPFLAEMFSSNYYRDEVYMNLPFWQDVFSFLENHPIYERETFRIFFNYVVHQRVENTGWSIKGRTMDSLFRQIEEHEAEQRRLRTLENYRQSWNKAEIEDYKLQSKKSTIFFKQIHTLDMLINESEVMKHCIMTYYSRIINGSSIIFSMTKQVHLTPKEIEAGSTPNPEEHLQTIEIQGDKVVQVRGFKNRGPNIEENKIIQTFIQNRNLKAEYGVKFNF